MDTEYATTDFEIALKNAANQGWQIDHALTDRGSRTWVRPGSVQGFDVKMWFGDEHEIDENGQLAKREDAFQGALLSRRWSAVEATPLRWTDDLIEASVWLSTVADIVGADNDFRVE